MLSKPLNNFPKERMREYTDKEFPWEYREYTHYSKSAFPKAFDSADHFKQKYDAAPLVHLHHDELKNLDYSTVGSFIHHDSNNVQKARNLFSHRRDVDRIENDLYHGKTAPPIVLKHSKGLRILGGNTRLSVAAAHGMNMPVKLIDISDRH